MEMLIIWILYRLYLLQSIRARNKFPQKKAGLQQLYPSVAFYWELALLGEIYARHKQEPLTLILKIKKAAAHVKINGLYQQTKVNGTNYVLTNELAFSEMSQASVSKRR